MDIPEGATIPQDHQVARAQFDPQPETDDEDPLADLPPLRSANKLRIRAKNELLFLSLKVKGLLEDKADENGEIDLNLDELTEEELRPLLTIVADFDEFAEEYLAKDCHDEYVAWAEGADHAQLLALLMRYGSAVGEAVGSTS